MGIITLMKVVYGHGNKLVQFMDVWSLSDPYDMPRFTCGDVVGL